VYYLVLSRKYNPSQELLCVESEIELSKMNMSLGQKLCLQKIAKMQGRNKQTY